jgi:hypothetical protein
VLTSNLVLKAAFATNAFAASQTSYNGLFYQQDINTGADSVLQTSSGSFAVATTKKGRYTGHLQIGSVRYPFSGKLDSLGQGTNVLHHHGASDLTLGFYLVGDVAYGQVSDGTWTNDYIVADRAVFNTRTNPAPFAGQYTVILPGHDSDPSVPAGDGFGAVRVSKSGIASVTGTLADGTHFSQSAPVSKDRNWPFYAPLYAGKGSALSWLSFTNTATNDLNGYLSWIKPPVPNANYYAGGFSTNCFAVGSTYIHGPASHLLNLESANVAFTGGNVSSSFTNSVTMLTTTVLNHNQNSLHMGLSLGNGLFHGTVTDPTSATFHSFYGAAFQKLNVGYGTLLGTDQSSRVTISE